MVVWFFVSDKYDKDYVVGLEAAGLGRGVVSHVSNGVSEQK